MYVGVIEVYISAGVGRSGGQDLLLGLLTEYGRSIFVVGPLKK